MKRFALRLGVCKVDNNQANCDANAMLLTDFGATFADSLKLVDTKILDLLHKKFAIFHVEQLPLTSSRDAAKTIRSRAHKLYCT